MDLIGKKIGRLTVLENVGKENGYTLWRCKCDCGNEKVVSGKYLGKGTRSCGCLSRELASLRLKTHGQAKTRIYRVYRTMMGRCNNPNAHEYANYGGRGIGVCNEWNTFENFYDWAMQNGYSDELTIDRIDPNGNYEPSNCRFVDMKHQQRNRRNNVNVTYNGETHCLSEWAEIIGIGYGTLLKRRDANWSTEDMLTRPVQVHMNR